eukprot:8335296-Pyramimonas_sp.AAC.1
MLQRVAAGCSGSQRGTRTQIILGECTRSRVRNRFPGLVVASRDSGQFGGKRRVGLAGALVGQLSWGCLE